MNNTSKQINDYIHTRPIDPSRNYGDMIGDTSGLTGMTTGNAAQSSAEPDDTTDVDTAHLPGGIIQNTKQTQPTGIPKTAISNNAYNRSVGQTMSSTAAQAADDQTTDEDTNQTDQPVTQLYTPTSPAIQGEQSVSGDMPDVESDDDTLQNAHAMGEQVDEDLEHPQELDLSRDIDKAEEHIRTH